MAQVVDATGKVRAPRTNIKTTTPTRGGGANALRKDLSTATGVDLGPSNYENALVNILQDDVRAKPTNTVGEKSKSSVQYSGLSGGTPVVASSNMTQGSWSPTMSSPTGISGGRVASKKNDVSSGLSRLHQSKAPTAAGALSAIGAFPDPSSWVADTQDEQDELNSQYEEMFSRDGMSGREINDIHSRGGLLDTLMGNPATQAATDNIMSNPWLDVDVNELQVPGERNDNNTLDDGDMLDWLSSLFDENGNYRGPDFGSVANDTLGWLSGAMFDENGNYRGPNIPDEYASTTQTTIGDRAAIDDGTVMDYDHLTADRVSGEQMQRYVDEGMGGRTWWEYSPYMAYLKSDEAQHHGYRPYLPDDMSKLNMEITSALDTPGDLAGALSEIRTNSLPSYSIKYDVDGDQNTRDDVLTFDGRDWDYRDTAYYHNINKLAAENPDVYLRYPKDGEIHGAPVSTTILENAVKDVDGNTVYTYGNISDIDPGDDYSVSVPLVDGTFATVPLQDFKPDENGNPTELPQWLQSDEIDWDENKKWEINDDYTYYKIHYSDGSVVNVPVDEYDSWFDESNKVTDAYPGRFIPSDDVSGTPPENLDSLNDYYRENLYKPKRDTWMDYPIHYIPDMVMSDGTRVPYSQFQDIYYDVDRVDKKPNDFAGTKVAYDYNMANKPKSLMKGGGQLFNEDLSLNMGDFLPGAFDSTMGSLPISFDQIAWPLSVSTALSKSLSGLEANGYDALTDSDMYMSGRIDKKTGKFIPLSNDIDRIAGIAGNSLIPATESIAGHVSGRSLIPALSGDIPVNPTLWQLAKAWALGNAGEGIEEIPGNVFDEISMYADKAYGTPIDPTTGKPLMKRGNPLFGILPGQLVPVTDENGDYMFVDKTTGEPITEMRDSMGHVYKDPKTSAVDRLANFYTGYDDILNALAGGFSVGGMMSLPYMASIPQAIRNTAYRREMGLPQYIEPEEVEERTEIDPESVKRYLGNRE